MIAWGEWRPEAFARAQGLGAPVLLLLPAGKTGAEIETAFTGLDAWVGRCVTLCADRCDRPDIHLRYGEGAAVCLLSHSGHLIDRCALVQLRSALPRWIEKFRPQQEPLPPESPSWTGAVGADIKRALPIGRPREVLDSVLAAKRPLSLGALELLLYAAAEWRDSPARARVALEMQALSRMQKDARTLGEHACAVRLLWDSHAVLGLASLREAALSATSRMIRDLYDSQRRAFRHATAGPARGGLLQSE